jgi:hypothetical protein
MVNLIKLGLIGINMLISLNKFFVNIFVIFILLVIFSFSSITYSDYWPDDTYTHFSKNEPLSEMLEAMALDQDLPIILSEKITDKISAYFRKKKTNEIFSILQRTYGLVAYFDGDALYVYKNDEVISKTITLNKSPVKFLEKALFDTGAMDAKVKADVKWRINTKLNSVTFRGVRRFVDLTESLAKKLNSSNYIYQWRDKKGRQHYSNDPPFGNKQYLDIMSISATSSSASNYQRSATNIEKKTDSASEGGLSPPPINATSTTLIH